MNEATQPGADLQSAAKAIGGLMDKKPQAEEASHESESAENSQEAKHDKVATHTQDEPDHGEGEEEGAEESLDADSGEDAEFELPSSLDKLAELMKTDVSKLHNVKVKTKIDGQEGEATLADLIKSYQLEGHLTKKSMSLAEQQKALENEVHLQRQEINNQLQQLHAHTQFLEGELFREFQAVDWQALRDYNPAEFAAKQLEFQARKSQIENFNHQVNQRFQQEMHKQRQENEARKTQYSTFLTNVIKQEEKALVEKIPEWSTPEKRAAGQTELRSYLLNQGFENDDLDVVIDHRYVSLARKAMLYDKMAQTKPNVLKKAEQLPKFIKQSGVKSKADIRAENKALKAKQLRKTGSLHDAASMLVDLM